MKLLADSAFPASVAGPQPGGHHVDRYTGVMLGDLQLVEYASRSGYNAVAFVGRGPFASPGLVERCNSLGILLGCTSSSDPDEAELALRANLERLSRLDAGSPPVIVRKGGVGEWEGSASPVTS